MPRVAPATPGSLEDAANRLRAGDVVAFPTETVYGLGAGVFNQAGLEKIYVVKGRPFDNPLIAHVRDQDQARSLAREWDKRCEALAARFWPGPLTLVVMKDPRVPALATAGLETIAIRSPDHPVAIALLESFGGPIAAPSANRSGRVSPTTAQHVADDFADVDDLLILDGGPCAVGIESTVLDVSGSTLRVLRPGSVGVADIREASRETLGEGEGIAIDDEPITEQAASPGTRETHYAPRTPARLVECGEIESIGTIGRDRNDDDAAAAAPGCLAVLTFDASIVPPPHIAIEMPRDATAYAAKLYDALRVADAQGSVHAILIERPPTTGDLWPSIHDRLRRATQKKVSG